MIRWLGPCSGLWGGGCQEANHPPSLGFVEDQVVFIGDGLRLVLVGTDPDGDALEFALDGLPSEARLISQAKDETLLYWNPTIADTEAGGITYHVHVTATDGHGGTAEQRFDVVVYPIYGVPIVDLPGGVVLNLAQEQALALLVAVKDDDSLQVQIEMTEGPEGAKLKVADAKSAYFYWEPSAEQRRVAIHRAVFSVRDETHAAVTHSLLIILLNTDEGAGCEGQPPTIAHTPAPDQAVKGAVVTFQATVQDIDSKVSAATLHWTRSDPTAGFETVPMTTAEDAAGVWTVNVTTAGLPSAGELLRYYLTARDNDDPTAETCDHTSRLPKKGYFTAAVYPPGSLPGACIDDPAEPDDDMAAAKVLSPGLHGGRRLCGKLPDIARVHADEGETLMVRLVHEPDHGPVTLRLHDATYAVVAEVTPEDATAWQVEHTAVVASELFVEVSSSGAEAGISYALDISVSVVDCPPDALEPNDTPAAAPSPGAGSFDDLRICPGDVDVLRFDLAASTELQARIAFAHQYGDLDMEILAADQATVLATAAGEGSAEELSWAASAPQTVYLRVHASGGETNSYDLVTELVAVGATCEDDILHPQTSPETAPSLFQGLYEGLRACPGAADWFALDLNGGEKLTVALEAAEGPSPRLDVYLDPAGAPAASGVDDGTGILWAEVQPTTAGRVYYRVEATSAASGYFLLQDVTDPPGPCQPDRFEPNDTMEQAVPTPSQVHTWLRLCGADRDMFRVGVAPFSTLIVVTQHLAGQGYSDLRVFDEQGVSVSEQLDYDKGAALEVLLEEAGEYTIVVESPGAGSLPYDLAIFVQ